MLWVLHGEALRAWYEDAFAAYRLCFHPDTSALVQAFETEGDLPDLLVAYLHPGGPTLLDLLGDGPAWPRAIPIVVVSWIDDVELIRRCYALGVREYLSAPVHEAELVVKIERMLCAPDDRACAREAPRTDPITLTLQGAAHSSPALTAKEFQIVSRLVAASGGAVSRTEIMHAAWRGLSVGPKTLDVHLTNLRKKLAPLGMSIRSDGAGALALESMPVAGSPPAHRTARPSLHRTRLRPAPSDRGLRGAG